jgi:hypothetical protein
MRNIVEKECVFGQRGSYASWSLVFIVKTVGHSFALGMHHGKVASERPSLFLTKAFDLGSVLLFEQPLRADTFLCRSN